MNTHNLSQLISEGILDTSKTTIHPAIERHLIKETAKFKEDRLNVLTDDARLNCSLPKYSFDVPDVSRQYDIALTTTYMTRPIMWTGFVKEVHEGIGFHAELYDVKEPLVKEFADFDIMEVSENDLGLLKEGAMFYWSLGYETKGGTRTKRSFLRFKRVGKWTEENYNRAIDKADDFFESLNWGDDVQ